MYTAVWVACEYECEGRTGGGSEAREKEPGEREYDPNRHMRWEEGRVGGDNPLV